MLETERIILRKIEPKDAPTLLKWGQDNIYHKSAGYQYLQDLDAVKKVPFNIKHVPIATV